MPLPRATAALVAAAVLAGCGGGEPTASAKGGRIAVELDDFLIQPQNITARAGPLTFSVTNRGRLVHSFHVQRPDREAVRITRLQPGASATATADLAPGEYRLVCVESNHAELGMTGRLVVR
jgi:iron uptake system component EfeO